MAKACRCRPIRAWARPASISSPPFLPARRSPCRPAAAALPRPGLVFEIPAGFEAQVRPRSGLALKQGVTVLNAPGTIDSDYRGYPTPIK